MSNCCDIDNPLIRDGTSQRKRQVLALSPGYIEVDEWDLADFLVFAYKLSQQVRYYNKNNQPDGNWQDFFISSTPVQIALISKTYPQSIKEIYDQHLNSYLKEPSSTKFASLLRVWANDLLNQILQWYENLESYTPLKSTIKGLIKTNLPDPLKRMWAFEKAYREDTKRLVTERDFYNSFNRIFDLKIDEPLPDSTPLPAEFSNSQTKLEVRAELDAVFQGLFQTYQQIIKQAQNLLESSLSARQDHPPHLALYYAFWKVLQPARADLNRMTQRHLDFFYKEVLKLSLRPAQPDQAHLLFELTKSQIEEYKLETDTRFKAGKDAKGIELLYQLDEATIVHKAQINSLKNLFVDEKEIKPTDRTIQKNILGLYVSPQANSVDGNGKDFPKEQAVKAWLPFGNMDRSHAKLGLAIASALFFLQEGTRIIVFELKLNGGVPSLTAENLKTVFEIWFSGEKEWLSSQVIDQTIIKRTDGQTTITNVYQTGWQDGILTLVAELLPGAGAVLPYHADLAGPKLNTIQPVACLYLKDQETINTLSPYHYFRGAELTELTVQVDVKEVRNLVLQNDLTVLDPTKPFQPFGPQPKIGANLYIGSQEVFQKKLTALTIHIELEQPKPKNWLDVYAAYDAAHDDNDLNQVASTFNPGKLRIQALRERNWSAETSVNLFDGWDISLDETQLTNLQLNSFIETAPFDAWTLQSKNGFLRFQLTGTDFLHKYYPIVLARQVLAGATNESVFVPNISPGFSVKRKAVIGAIYKYKGNFIRGGSNKNDYGEPYVEPDAEPVIPKEAYTPIITSLYLNYTAKAIYKTQTIADKAEQKEIYLYHLYPFDGFEEVSKQFPHLLLPTFIDEGTLYIGLQDLIPPTVLSLLFQMAEETANTDLKRAELHWFYLHDNEWRKFEDYQTISDTTQGLISSGIVKLAIPEDISRAKTTILDPSLHWIKVSVPERSTAICHIISVHTQAARVTFTNQNNDPSHLATPLPPGTISKLANPQPEIKKVEQPYASFGGRVEEQATYFYTRINEHLRHKGRAVTIFDYERLVLEKYPEIYKVRCINHGQVDTTGNLHELVPGALTLVVIPDLSKRSTANDLEPKVNINLLEKVKEYLAKLSSSWAEIQVVNPIYEKIRVEFQVKFKESYQANSGYYSRQLEQSIIRFLAPWTIDSGAEINFGGKLYRSSILNFIEEQTYVDYVLNFQMHQENQLNLREAVASSARSILTSVPLSDPLKRHIIQHISNEPTSQRISSGRLGYESLDRLKLNPE